MQTKLGFEGDHSFKKPTSAPDPKASFQQRAVITTVMGCSLLFWGGDGQTQGSLTALQGGLSLERSLAGGPMTQRATLHSGHSQL